MDLRNGSTLEMRLVFRSTRARYVKTSYSSCVGILACKDNARLSPKADKDSERGIHPTAGEPGCNGEAAVLFQVLST